MVDPGIPDVYEAGYYVHDRLGSVRLVVRPIEEPGGWVVRAANSYTYTPYGSRYDVNPQDGVENPWKFTGQWHDVEIDQYYLRARQYDPTMMRFTSRDPVLGEQQEPLTLHKYLYCKNDPLNQLDPTGESAMQIAHALVDAADVYAWGLTVAAVGAGMGNLDLINIGTYIMELSPIVFAVSYATQGVVDGKAIINSKLFRGPEYGRWKQGGIWVSGTHFHLDWGSGLGKHHLPQQFGNWIKNFKAVYGELVEATMDEVLRLYGG